MILPGTVPFQPNAALPLDFFTTPLSRELASAEQIRGGPDDPATAVARQTATPPALQEQTIIRPGRPTPLLHASPGDITLRRPNPGADGEGGPEGEQDALPPDPVPPPDGGRGAPPTEPATPATPQQEKDGGRPPDSITPHTPEPRTGQTVTPEESDAYFSARDTEPASAGGRERPPAPAPAEGTSDWPAAELALAGWAGGWHAPRRAPLEKSV